MSNIREWAPLTDLFNLLPTKVQSGLFSTDVKLTCIDVLPEFLALGTNFGLVYWYDRKKNNLQKLRCENTRSSTTVVKVASTVDYMVACGNAEGNISIFQVPIAHPESLPESLRPKNKQVERYTVSELHGGPITALEWSKNGMKLFSGDKIGRIVLTELDFNMHICRSIEIINESYEVVQISCYLQNLLVSTTYRSIICKKEDKWKVAQIGKSDRKILDSFGGTFYQNGPNPKDVILYCTRPGLRMWISDMDGNVDKTLLFKDIITQSHSQIPLINPISTDLKRLRQPKEASFGILIPFNDLLLTYNNDILYILDPKNHTINLAVNHLRRILSVAVSKDEIFILEGERSLIRLSKYPEQFNESRLSIASSSVSNKFETNNGLPLVFPFKVSELTVHTDVTSVTNAEEAIELSSPSRKIPTVNEALKKLEIYAKISNQDFDDDILYKPKSRKKSTATMSSASSEDRESVSISTLMNISTIGILPDLRSHEAIAKDIENKEKLLANVLCFNNLAKTEIKENVGKKEKKIETKQKLNVKEETKDLISKPIENVQHDDSKSLKKIEEINATVAVPACTSVPSDWNIQKVTLQESKITKRSESEDLTDDWEMI